MFSRVLNTPLDKGVKYETLETLDKSVKYVQSKQWKYKNDVNDVVLAFLLLILNIFHTFTWRFYCWLWRIKFYLGCDKNLKNPNYIDIVNTNNGVVS